MPLAVRTGAAKVLMPVNIVVLRAKNILQLDQFDSSFRNCCKRERASSSVNCRKSKDICSNLSASGWRIKPKTKAVGASLN